MQWSLPTVPDENAGTDKPTVVVYPHFASIGMHSDYVDWYRSETLSRSSSRFTLTDRQCQILG
jgi:polycomb protein EED